MGSFLNQWGKNDENCTRPIQTLKVLVSGREAPEKLTRSVGLLFFILDFF